MILLLVRWCDFLSPNSHSNIDPERSRGCLQLATLTFQRGFLPSRASSLQTGSRYLLASQNGSVRLTLLLVRACDCHGTLHSHVVWGRCAVHRVEVVAYFGEATDGIEDHLLLAALVRLIGIYALFVVLAFAACEEVGF